MPYTTSVAGTTITASWANASIRDQVVTPFADAAARTAAVTSPLEGMVSYLTGSDRMDVYNGSAYEGLSASGSWTPTLTNAAIGTGGSAALTGSYSYNRGELAVDIVAVLGTSGQSVTGNPTFSLPSGFAASRVSSSSTQSVGVGLIAAATYFEGVAHCATSSNIVVLVKNAASTYLGRTAITNLIPATWAAGDAIFLNGTIKGVLT